MAPLIIILVFKSLYWTFSKRVTIQPLTTKAFLNMTYIACAEYVLLGNLHVIPHWFQVSNATALTLLFLLKLL